MFKQFVLAILLAATSLAAVAIPRPAGDVTFRIAGKGPDNLSHYRGKVVLVVIFMPSCEHCQHSTKFLTEIQRDLKPRGFQVIELAFRDEDTDPVLQKFIKTYQTNFPVGAMTGPEMLKFTQVTAEMRPTVPMVFFIDRNGIVRAQFFSSEPFMEEQVQARNIRALASKLLEENAAPVKPAKK